MQCTPDSAKVGLAGRSVLDVSLASSGGAPCGSGCEMAASASAPASLLAPLGLVAGWSSGRRCWQRSSRRIFG